MPLFAAKVYVVACVTHAKDVLAAALGMDRTNEFLNLTILIDEFWSHYPQSTIAPLSDSLAGQAGAMLPGEEGGNSGWEDALVWASAYAFSVMRRDQTSKELITESLEALHQAYWSVFGFTHERDHVYSTDDAIQLVLDQASLSGTFVTNN